jgi:hypothetical protein
VVVTGVSMRRHEPRTVVPPFDWERSIINGRAIAIIAELRRWSAVVILVCRRWPSATSRLIPFIPLFGWRPPPPPRIEAEIGADFKKLVCSIFFRKVSEV